MNKKDVERSILISFIIICLILSLKIYYVERENKILANDSCSNSFESWNKANLSCDLPNTDLVCSHSLPMKDGSIYCNIDDIKVKHDS